MVVGVRGFDSQASASRRQRRRPLPLKSLSFIALQTRDVAALFSRNCAYLCGSGGAPRPSRRHWAGCGEHAVHAKRLAHGGGTSCAGARAAHKHDLAPMRREHLALRRTPDRGGHQAETKESRTVERSLNCWAVRASHVPATATTVMLTQRRMGPAKLQHCNGFGLSRRFGARTRTPWRRRNRSR